MLTLKGRTVVSVGLGLAGAEELLEAGMNVVIFTHTDSLTNSIKERLGDKVTEDNFMVIPEGYVDKDEAVIPGLEKVFRKFGSVDCVVTFSGGPGTVRNIEDITLDEINTEVPYLTATSFNFTKRALPYLRKSKAGRVIYVSTTEAQTGGMNGGMVDAVARGAVLSLTYNMARRLAADKITVNCISVGPFDKDMPHWKELPDIPDPYKLVEETPLHRVGTQKDVAYALHYLLSEEADFITGQVINLNGGIFMG